jgi:hypothetical protein
MELLITDENSINLENNYGHYTVSNIVGAELPAQKRDAKMINANVFNFEAEILLKTKTKLHGLSPLANYTDRATAACRRSDCQLLRIKGVTWSA